MSKNSDITAINNWFMSCGVSKAAVPYVLGLLAVTFQVAAWYSHTIFPDSYSMINIIVLSWLIALIEFIFLVPAISIAHHENIDLTLFTVYKISVFFLMFSLFHTFILKHEFMPKYLIAYVMMASSIYLLS